MARPSTSQTPVPLDADHIRIVVLVGPSGSGKTRLFDHLVSITTPGYRTPSRPDERGPRAERGYREERDFREDREHRRPRARAH